MLLMTVTLAAALGQATPTLTAAPKPAAETAPQAVLTKAPTLDYSLLPPAERAALSAERAALAAEQIAKAFAPQAVVNKEPAPPAGWKGLAGLNLALLAGNTQSFTLTFNLGLTRKWTVWALGIRAWAAYGTLTTTVITSVDAAGKPTTINGQYTTAEVTNVAALNAGASVRGDRFLTDIVSIYAAWTEDFDHIKNIEARHLGDLGVGFTLLNVADRKIKDWQKLYLRLDIGLRGGYETHWQYFPVSAATETPLGIGILAGRAALAFRWSPAKNIRISEDLEVIPYFLPGSRGQTAGRVLINNTTKLSAAITSYIALTAGFILNYDSQPPQPRIPPFRTPLDIILTLGAEAAF